MKRPAIILIVLALAVPASAQLPPFVRSAFDAVDMGQQKWAYTQTTVEEGSRTVEKFDPSRPDDQQWQLVIKNGHAPAQSELAAYAQEKEKSRQRNAKRKVGKDDLSHLIRPGSLRLIRESAAEAEYEFRLPLEGDKNEEEARQVIDSMKGRLTIVKNGPWLQVLEMENEKPIKPVVAVRIDRMYTRMTFHAPAPGVPALLAELRATIRGRALFLKKLDVDSVVTYTDYRAVAGSR